MDVKKKTLYLQDNQLPEKPVASEPFILPVKRFSAPYPPAQPGGAAAGSQPPKRKPRVKIKSRQGYHVPEEKAEYKSK